MHHGTRPRYRSHRKFKSPRKRASKLLGELNKEAVDMARQEKPNVFGENVRVGDSVELEVIGQGGVNATHVEKVRGLVLGKVNRGLGSSIYIKDVMYGEPVEWKIPLYSPLVKSLKVLERNFLFKGKRKVKRAKLYYLRDRSPNGTFCLCSRILSFAKFFVEADFWLYRVPRHEMVGDWARHGRLTFSTK